MSEVVALELAVVDLIEARALDPADFPMPQPPLPRVTPGRLFPEELDDRENQARSPDDVANPARKLVRHSRCLPNKNPPDGRVTYEARSLYKYDARQGFPAGATSQTRFLD